jgi:hypothetical protein
MKSERYIFHEINSNQTNVLGGSNIQCANLSTQYLVSVYCDKKLDMCN